MKRTIMIVLVAGSLMLGALAGIENALDRISFHQNKDFLDSGEDKDFSGLRSGNTGSGFSTPTGGHQGGAGDVPG